MPSLSAAARGGSPPARTSYTTPAAAGSNALSSVSVSRAVSAPPARSRSRAGPLNATCRLSGNG